VVLLEKALDFRIFFMIRERYLLIKLNCKKSNDKLFLTRSKCVSHANGPLKKLFFFRPKKNLQNTRKTDIQQEEEMLLKAFVAPKRPDFKYYTSNYWKQSYF